MPKAITFLATFSEVICAAYGVDFLEPLNPLCPEDDHANTEPSVSEIVTIVLLKVARILAIPMFIFFSFFYFRNVFVFIHNILT